MTPMIALAEEAAAATVEEQQLGRVVRATVASRDGYAFTLPQINHAQVESRLPRNAG